MACSDRNVYAWYVAEGGGSLLDLRGHDGEVVTLDTSPAHPIAMTYSWDEKSRLWNVHTAEPILVTDWQLTCFDHRGERFAGRTTNTFGISRFEHGDVLRTFYGHAGKSPRGVAISRAQVNPTLKLRLSSLLTRNTRQGVDIVGRGERI